MTAEEFVQSIVTPSPIVPMEEHNECRFCRAGWAEESYEEWQSRELASDSRGWLLRDHHALDCIWVLANQVELT